MEAMLVSSPETLAAPETEGMEVEPLVGTDGHMQPISWESRVAHMKLGELMGVPMESLEIAGVELLEGDSLGEELAVEQPHMETDDKASSTVDAAPEEDSQDRVKVHTSDDCFL